MNADARSRNNETTTLARSALRTVGAVSLVLCFVGLVSGAVAGEFNVTRFDAERLSGGAG